VSNKFSVAVFAFVFYIKNENYAIKIIVLYKNLKSLRLST